MHAVHVRTDAVAPFQNTKESVSVAGKQSIRVPPRPSSTLPEVKRAPKVILQQRPNTVDPAQRHEEQVEPMESWAESLLKTSNSFAGSARLPLGDTYVPINIINSMMQKNSRPPPAQVQESRSWMDKADKGIPFSRLNSRQYVASTISNIIKRASPDFAGHPETLPQRYEVAPTRTEAHLLLQAYETMTANIRADIGGLDPMMLARQAALEAQADTMMSLLEPEYYAMDTVLAELGKQIGVGCKERGDLLELCRKKLVDCFATTALCLHELNSRRDDNVGLPHVDVHTAKSSSKNEERDFAVQRLAAMELEMGAMQQDLKSLQEELELARRVDRKTADNTKHNSQKELKLMEQVEELESINGHIKSRLAIVEAQLQKAEVNNGVLQAQVQEFHERIKRDAEHLEGMSEAIARYKVRSAWLRAIAFVRRQKRDRAEQETQTDGSAPLTMEADTEGADSKEDAAALLQQQQQAKGDKRGQAAQGVAFAKGTAGGGSKVGSLAAVGAGQENTPGEGLTGRPPLTAGLVPLDVAAVHKRKGLGIKDQLMNQQGAIPYATFWSGILKSAEQLDVTENVMLQMSKRQVLEFIGKIYTEKILVDEVDDRAHIPRQNLPEFLYDYHLELLSEPLLAEEALINIVANTRMYEGVSARVKMFCRFLNMNTEKPLPTEALSVYLLALVKIQNGEIPLLPDYDGLNVDADKCLKVLEYVFAQAPYVIRSKIMLEAEKRCVGRNVDVDSLLYFMVDQWLSESGRAEERLRALFVASDVDGDGNLTLTEFTNMVKHVNSRKSHRELLRMYAEMTLNRTVDCNTFVRVCRKFSFFSFLIGPANKKADRSSAQVFEVLSEEWLKVSDMVNELLVVLEGTAVGMRLEQHVATLQSLLSARMEAEAAWHCYRKVISEFTSAIKNRTPGMGQGVTKDAPEPLQIPDGPAPKHRSNFSPAMSNAGGYLAAVRGRTAPSENSKDKLPPPAANRTPPIRAAVSPSPSRPPASPAVTLTQPPRK